jgi:hypothetical protein
VFHGLVHKGNLSALSSQGGGEGMTTNHGWSAIFANGTPAPPGTSLFANGTLAPPGTSLVASKALSMSVNVTKEHNMTMVGGASLNGGIFLAAAAVGKALKGSMAGERMNKSFGRELRGKRMS